MWKALSGAMRTGLGFLGSEDASLRTHASLTWMGRMAVSSMERRSSKVLRMVIISSLTDLLLPNTSLSRSACPSSFFASATDSAERFGLLATAPGAGPTILGARWFPCCPSSGRCRRRSSAPTPESRR